MSQETYVDNFGYDSDRLVRCWHILDNDVTADFIAIKAREHDVPWDVAFSTLKSIYYCKLSSMTCNQIVHVHLKHHLYSR